MFVSYYFSRKTDLKKHLLMKVNMKKFIWIHLQTTKKKTEDGENLFFKALANRFWLTSKSSTKLFMTNLLSKGLHEKVNDMLLKVD